MAGIIRRLRRSNKRAAKFRFTVTLQELQLLTDETWKPETLVVSFVHRRRKVSSKERKWEQSFSDQSKCVIIWPEQMSDSIDIVTTLYRAQDDDQYEDKEWTIVVEEVTAKGKRKAIAAVPLNVRLFILDLPEHKSELKLKLRPLVPKLRQSSLILLLGSVLLKEANGDDMSVTSSVMDRTVDEVDLAAKNAKRIQETRRELESVAPQPKPTTPAVAPIIFQKRDIEDEAPPPIPVHRQSIESEKVRPLWRVSQEPSEENAASTAPKRQSRTSRASTEESKTPSTTAVFEVDANSRPVPVNNNNLNTGTIPRKRSHSPRAPSRDIVPQPIVGEGLLAWCQRVTDGYTNLKITDFTKSWRNGLALCAILHTYRPDLIGDYEQLDFSDRVDGRKSNIKKALVATRLMGLNDIPDENDFLTPDKKSIELLLQKIRRIFEGNFEDATPTSASDHRISNMFGISEAEQKVVDMINKIREKEDEENAVDYSDVRVEEEPKVVENDGDFTDDDAETSNLHFGRNNVSVTMVTPGLNSIRASGRQASPSKRDELRRRARDMLDKSSKSSTLPTTPLANPDGENERRRDEARRLLEDATVDGTTFKITAARNAMTSTPHRNGSSTDLRRVEIIKPSVDVHRFKKRDPSPTLVRKQYDPNDTPHIPAISRSSNYGSRNRLDELLTSNPFDRVKRYGSMRSAELKESLQVLAKQYGYGAEDVMATPTKKYSSQWEKDVHDVEGTALEQEKIEQRINDVEQQSKAIEAKIHDTEKGGSEEQMLLETFLRLTNEKNTLVGRQEYYNIIENIRQTTQQIDKFAKKLDDMTKNADDYQKTPEEKSATDKLMEDYRKALDQKSTLIQKLFATEEEMHEDEERLNNLTLERASRFVRGIDQPVSASKRLMQWWRR